MQLLFKVNDEVFSFCKRALMGEYDAVAINLPYIGC